VRTDGGVGLGALEVHHELLGARAVDLVGLHPLVRGALQLGQEHAGEPLLAAQSGSDAHDDLVVPLLAPLLDLDEAAQCLGDGCRQRAAGEFLGPLVER
jgi:hypothetical protein